MVARLHMCVVSSGISLPLFLQCKPLNHALAFIRALCDRMVVKADLVLP